MFFLKPSNHNNLWCCSVLILSKIFLKIDKYNADYESIPVPFTNRHMATL